jgi:gliding motility-associated-like protein
MKSFYLFIFLLLNSIGFSQYCPSLGPNQILPCGVGSTMLTANLSLCGPGGPTPNQTTNYNVTSITYSPQTNTGTQLFMSDDSQQGPFNIGFSFCFFGNTYTQFYVGSNGWISFSPSQPTTFTSNFLPTTSALVPKNCVMGPWQDWHPGIGGQIKYQIQGIAPCRKLVISWTNMPMFSCTSNQGTFHIILYESTNVIENHIQSKPSCLTWQSGTATQGLHNIGGTVGITTPSRNSTAWVTTNNAYRWTPSGPAITPTLTWFQVGNPTPIGTGPTITVTPPSIGANYTCQFVYPSCNAGWNSCNSSVGSLGPDTVFVLPGPPTLPLPTINITNPLCFGSCNGTINVTPNGGAGINTISWVGQPPTFTLTNLCSGTYSYTIVDATGCNVSGITTLTNPPPVIAPPIIGQDTVCYHSTNTTYSTTNLGPGFTYQWSSTGTITAGQGTNSVVINWATVPSGFISNAINMVAINSNGCISDTVSFDVTIYNVIPIITPMGPFCSNDSSTTVSFTPIGGVLSGTGLIGNTFYPSNADTLNNTINYVYTQSNCVFDTTINIMVYEHPTISQITPYDNLFELCEGDSIPSLYTITSTVPGGYNDWSLDGNLTQSNSFNITWNSIGVFNLSVINYVNGCPSPQQNTTITIIECPQTLFYVPNSFTPNGDNLNDVWIPIFTLGFDTNNYHAQIYNRWGIIVWESNDPTKGWNGTHNNTLLSTGVYIWKITFGTNNKKGLIGVVNLIE